MTGRHRSPAREVVFTVTEVVIMILLGTVGVLMVLAARPLRRHW
jgi:hypothetical protein